jgi:hypothetical protein
MLDVHLTRAGELAFANLVPAHSTPAREDCAPPFLLWSGDGEARLREELHAADRSQRAKEEVIADLSAALDQANADRQAKERVILELSAALEDLRAAGA